MLRRFAGIALVGIVVLVVAGGPATAVTTPPPDPTPTPTPAVSMLPTPSASAGPLKPTDGVFFVSGVRTSYHQTWHPLKGTLHVEMTVRNVSREVLDASASVRATTVLGLDLGGSNAQSIRDIEPGEKRIVEADIEGVGQWGLFDVRVTFSPPKEVAGVELLPVERERWVFVPPWYVIGAVVLVVALRVVLRWYPVRRRHRSAAAGYRGSAQPVAAP